MAANDSVDRQLLKKGKKKVVDTGEGWGVVCEEVKDDSQQNSADTSRPEQIKGKAKELKT